MREVAKVPPFSFGRILGLRQQPFALSKNSIGPRKSSGGETDYSEIAAAGLFARIAAQWPGTASRRTCPSQLDWLEHLGPKHL